MTVPFSLLEHCRHLSNRVIIPINANSNPKSKELGWWRDGIMGETHRHCTKCISRYCKVPECPMINCVHGCGAIVHQCKVSDHEEVCFQKRVPCINAVYGCEAMMPRSRIKVHLAHCPASLVHCKFIWERVDRNLIKNQDHIRNSNGSDKAGRNYVEEFLASDVERIKNNLEAKERDKELSAILEPSAAHHLLVGAPHHRSFPYGRGQKNLVVKRLSPLVCCFYMTTESSDREQLHVLIRCNEVVRRDEFEDHYMVQHNIVHSGLYGWLVHHCPLNEYGCDFSIPRLLPSPKYFKLVYNKCSRVFAAALKDEYLPVKSEDTGLVDGWYTTRLAQQRELAAYGYDDVPTDPLSHLPIEVFRVIITFLDSSSLFCLSLTCQKLRELCGNLIKGNMVQLAWNCHGECWKDISKVWSYSCNTQVSYNWQFITTTGAMNKHLRQCPYANVQPYNATELWHCLPREQSDMNMLGRQVPSSSVDFGKFQKLDK